MTANNSIMKTHAKILLSASSLALALCGFVPSASALTVSPPTYSYTLNPGDPVRDVIKLYNESGETITLYPEVFNFTSKEGDETTGTPEFYPADEIRNGHELAPWITMSAE